MFGHYTYIAKQHIVALESAVALDGLKAPVQPEGYYTSSLRAGNITLSSVTDAKTGIWLQLAKVEGQAYPYLTLGQKWAMEQYVPAHGNVSTIFW